MDPDAGRVLAGCELSPGERLESTKGFTDAIDKDSAFILSDVPILFPTANGLCVHALAIQRDVEVCDADEAWIYVTVAVAAVGQPLSPQLTSWLILHESPISTHDLSGKAFSRISRMMALERQSEPGQIRLLSAAEAHDSRLVKQLLDAGEDVNETSATGWTPLHCAASDGNLPLVETLLEHGAHIDAQNRHGRTPLNVAAGNGHLAVVKMLLELNAGPNLYPNDELSSLNQAIITHKHDVMKILLEHGAEATRKDNFGFAPLFIASNDATAAMILLDHGVDPNLDLVGGSRLLHTAARGGNTVLARYLIENGAEVDLREGYEGHGRTPLYLALEEQNIETVQVLINSGADPNKPVLDSWTPMLLAAKIGNYDVLRVLLKANSKHTSDACEPEHWTALHLAAKHGHRLPVKALLETGWDPTAEDAFGSTPAQLAMEAGHISTAEVIKDFHLRVTNHK